MVEPILVFGASMMVKVLEEHSRMKAAIETTTQGLGVLLGRGQMEALKAKKVKQSPSRKKHFRTIEQKVVARIRGPWRRQQEETKAN